MAFIAAATSCSFGHTSLPRPVDVELDRGVCRSVYGTYDCSRIIETSQLKAAGGLVTRRGNRLCFLTSSPEICIADEEVGENGQDRSFSYLGTLSRPRSHVVWVQYWEGSAAMLVDAATGTKQLVDAMPVPSPDGQYVAVSSADLGAAYNPNRLSVWAVVGDALQLVWSIEPDDWMPGAVRWIDPTKFEMSRIAIDADSKEERVIDTVTVQRDSVGWRLLF